MVISLKQKRTQLFKSQNSKEKKNSKRIVTLIRDPIFSPFSELKFGERRIILRGIFVVLV